MRNTKRVVKGRSIKRQCEMLHFNKRCDERLGHMINQKKLVHMIQNNELEFYYKASNSKSVWIYVEEGNEYVVVYDKLRKTVVTIYPYDEKHEWEKLLGKEKKDEQMVHV